MRQLNINDHEGPLHRQLSNPSQASSQHAGVIPVRGLQHDIDQAQSNAEELLEQCSRDTPLLESLNFLTYLSTPILILILFAALYAGEGAAVVVTASSLVGMNFAMRRALERSYAKDSELFAELGPETVGILLDCIGRSNTRVEAVASQVLAQLLPTLSRVQFEALPPFRRRALYTWMSDGSSAFSESKMTILRWLVDVADSEVVPHIEQVCKRFTFSPTQRSRKKEARSALDQILDRLDKEHTADESGAKLTDAMANASAIAEEDDLETTEESRALLSQVRKHGANRASPGMRMGFLLANWCFITPYVAYKFWESISMHGGLLANGVWLILTAASTQLYRVSLTPAHTRMAKQLANTGDTRAIGALAEALEWPDEEIQVVARAALLRLLPKLTSNDAPLLNSRQRRCLNHRLVLANARNYLDSELQVKILQAWEKVGDLSSLQVVKSLVAAKPVLKNERKVHKAAELCLPHLEECAHLNQSSQFLLRASGISDARAETLVRPASANEIKDEELLRPTD